MIGIEFHFMHNATFCQSLMDDKWQYLQKTAFPLLSQNYRRLYHKTIWMNPLVSFSVHIKDSRQDNWGHQSAKCPLWIYRYIWILSLVLARAALISNVISLTSVNWAMDFYSHVRNTRWPISSCDVVGFTCCHLHYYPLCTLHHDSFPPNVFSFRMKCLTAWKLTNDFFFSVFLWSLWVCCLCLMIL